MSEDVTAPKSFYVNADFAITIGKESTPLTIPRLKFRKNQQVLNIIAEVLAEDSGTILNMISDARKADLTLKFNDFTENTKKVIPLLLQHKRHDLIVRLLGEISMGAITEKHLDEMQYDEAVNLLQYLIEGNYGSLKNLSASLAAISTSAK